LVIDLILGVEHSTEPEMWSLLLANAFGGKAAPLFEKVVQNFDNGGLVSRIQTSYIQGKEK
jgi:hypothetical protein